MFIKFDELDMLDFFESNPILIGEEGEANFIYSIKDVNRFSMTMTVDVYARQIDISIGYGDDIVFAGQFENVIEIKKSESILLVEMEDKRRLVIKKESCLGVICEK